MFARASSALASQQKEGCMSRATVSLGAIMQQRELLGNAMMVGADFGQRRPNVVMRCICGPNKSAPLLPCPQAGGIAGKENFPVLNHSNNSLKQRL